MKKVLTVGVFDLLHWGHFELFRRAKELSQGGTLTVAVQEDSVINDFKPGTNIIYPFEKRVKMIQTLRTVDYVIPYRSVDDLIPTVEFDIFIRGEDQLHIGFQRVAKWCANHNREVIILPRTQGISTTLIKSFKR